MRRRRERASSVLRRAVASLGLLCLAGCSASPSAAPPEAVPVTPQAELTTTALSVSAVKPPVRVGGSDRRTHVEYDLVLQNVFSAPVTVTSIEVLGPDGSVLLALDGPDVAAVTSTLFPGPPTAVVPAGGALAAVIDLAAAPEEVPGRITHRIRYEPGPSPAAAIVGTREISGPELTVDPREPTVIAAPLKGTQWLNMNACCASGAPHRASRLAVGGNTIKKVEEFAVDWVQGRNGRLFDGDGSRKEQWYGFGADVLAVVDGTVAATFDGLPDQAPNTPATGLRGPRDYTGNHVSQQIAPGVWAIYGHLQPGSITVRTGDQVKKGQVIGKLGSSGNARNPHLHFQLSDGPEMTTSNSVPFAVGSYWLAGTVDPGQLATAFGDHGAPAPLKVTGPGRQELGTYPLAYTVTNLGY
ncbi:M23 family metallopeptidase [Mycobacterium sp. LTG2003]